MDDITHVFCCDDPSLGLCGSSGPEFDDAMPTCVVCLDLIGRPFCPKLARCKEWEYLPEG